MKKNLLILIIIVFFSIPGTVFAQVAQDWHIYHKLHAHLDQAIHEVEIARMANHYGMAGKSEKTEQFLRLAENELRLANNSTNSDR